MDRTFTFPLRVYNGINRAPLLLCTLYDTLLLVFLGMGYRCSSTDFHTVTTAWLYIYEVYVLAVESVSVDGVLVRVSATINLFFVFVSPFHGLRENTSDFRLWCHLVHSGTRCTSLVHEMRNFPTVVRSVLYTMYTYFLPREKDGSRHLRPRSTP